EEVVAVFVDNGRSKIKEKEALECVNCGSCLLECPVYDVVGKDFGGPAYLGGRGIYFTATTDSLDCAIDSGLALCTNCGLCEVSCPVNIDTPSLMRSVRADAVEARGPLEARHARIAKSIERHGNPWRQSRSARANWAKDLDLPTTGDALYFAGCTHSMLSPQVSRDAVKILLTFGQRVAYLDKNEGCCGSVLLKTGQVGAYEKARDATINGIVGSGASRVIVACPGCLAMLKTWDLENQGIEVEHITQTLDRLVVENPNRFSASNEKVTYHDPCDLGRHEGIYDEPRRILGSLPGVRLVEMKHSRERALCCGSGAGVRAAYPMLSERIASKRIGEALRTGARTVVTSCPWCESSLSKAAATSASGLCVVDLVSFVAGRLIEK
ncbi:MAG TPA: (Fe-S)-binding protein, partial [Methanomassiliicoccales archaeon]|nr:(Fe-S)-binding protein [Methanomassiliicoccales archaeon]